MWTPDFSHTGTRWLLLIGQLLALFICLIYIYYVYTIHIYPDQQARDFNPVTCSILDKKMSVHDSWTPSYRADFLISYNINGVQYNRWVSANGFDRSFQTNGGEEEETLAQYAIGAQYTCYYNPDDPQTSVLTIREDWLATFPLMIPAVIAILVFYYLFLNLYSLIIKPSAEDKHYHLK